MKLLLEFLITNGRKIIFLKLENVTWMHVLNYLDVTIRKL